MLTKTNGLLERDTLCHERVPSTIFGFCQCRRRSADHYKKMKNMNLNSIAAVFLMLWMWFITVAVIELFKESHREIDFSVCPLCDKSNLE